MQILKDIFYLFFPNSCNVCDKTLLQNELILCVQCRHDLPIICYKNYQKNKIIDTFYGRVPIKKAISFLYYRKDGVVQKLIHQLKYKNNQNIGSFFGSWFGHHIKYSQEFNDIDFIVPVPLHKKRLKERGYNQLTLFCERLSDTLNIIYKPGFLIKNVGTKTQTFKQRLERFTNVHSNFFLTDLSIFENKHILLIDDVITTGATIEACCNELLKTPNITISIATIAYTEKQ